MGGIYTSDVSESSGPPIGPYERLPVAMEPWDPRSPAVAARVIALVEARRPDLRVEHIGSTAVPGLPGKGIVDLGTEADPAEIAAITDAMYELGFGPQPGPDPWPPARPMHVGSIQLDGRRYLLHLHVHPRGGDLHRDILFRDALRADPSLAHRYARIKSEIVERAMGRIDRVAYQDAKGRWIVETHERLGTSRLASAHRAAKEDVS
jgi:dephospho-CoA kinase